MELKPIVNLVDDDPATCDAMTVLFQSISLIVASYKTGEAFLDAWEGTGPGCLLLDLRMPGMSGLEVQMALRERQCGIPIIFVSGHATVPAAVRAMHKGALDFLTKPVDDEVLVEKVRSAVELDRKAHKRSIRQATIQARLDLLTPREYQVMEGVVAGHSNKIIARQLGISPKTVELHRANMMAKMHADSVARLVKMRLMTTT